jgi:hypothetical protein
MVWIRKVKPVTGHVHTQSSVVVVWQYDMTMPMPAWTYG